jgi:predicted Holliday junction resolvase-like endonuclease
MELEKAIEAVDHAAHQDDRWMFVALLVIGLVTIYFLTRYFMRQIAELQQEIAAVRTEFETHLRTANADMVAALTKSTEVIAHNSAIIEQIQRKLMA